MHLSDQTRVKRPFRNVLSQHLEIFVLTGYTARVSGANVRWRTRHEAQLLAMLAINHPSPTRRERIISLLWPASERRRGAHSLSECLRQLQQHVGPALGRDREHIWLIPEYCSADLWTLKRALKERDLRNIVQNYHGRPAHDLVAASKTCLWLEDFAVALEAEVRRVLIEIVRKSKEGGDWDSIVRAAAFANEVDLQVAEIQRAADEAARMLEEETNVGSTAVRVGGGPFVGRMTEFQSIFDRWRYSAADSVFVSVFVYGEPGIGKTRLITRVSRYAAIKGAHILSGRCSVHSKSLPYAPLQEALGTSIAFQSSAEAGDDAARASGYGPHDQTEAVAKQRLFAALAAQVEDAKDRPVVLVIDDFHWVDPSTCKALDYLALRSEQLARSLTLMLAYRPDELRDNLAAREVVARLQRHESLEVPLSGLAVSDLVSHLRSILPHANEQHLRLVAHRAGGNPLFAREWARHDDPTVPIPSSIFQAVQGRVRALGDLERWVLEIIAVSGQTLQVKHLQSIAGLTVIDLAKALEALHVRGFLAVSDVGVDLCHELFRDAVYYGIPAARRQLIHSFYYKQQGAELPVRFRHAKLAGDTSAASELALMYARSCEMLRAPSEEVSFLLSALECATPSQVEDVGRHTLARFFALRRQAEIERALRVLSTAGRRVGLVQDIAEWFVALESRTLNIDVKVVVFSGLDLVDALVGTSEEPLCVDVSRIAFQYFHTKSDKEAICGLIGRCQQAAKRARDPAVKAALFRLCGIYALYHFGDHRYRAKLKAAEHFASESGDRDTIETVNLAVAMSLYMRGHISRARTRFQRIHTLSTAQRLDSLSVRAVVGLIAAHTDAADPLSAVRIGEKALTAPWIADFPYEHMLVLYNTALAHAALGELEPTRRMCWQTIEASHHHEVWFVHAAARALIGLSALEEGRVAEAFAQRSQIEAILPTKDRWMDDLSPVSIFLARLSLLEDRVDFAMSELRDAIGTYASRNFVCEGSLLVEQARISNKYNLEYDRRPLAKVHSLARRRGAILLAVCAEECLSYGRRSVSE